MNNPIETGNTRLSRWLMRNIKNRRRMCIRKILIKILLLYLIN